MMPAKGFSFQEIRDGGPCTPGAHWSRPAPEDNGFASMVRLLAFEKRRGPGLRALGCPPLKRKLDVAPSNLCFLQQNLQPYLCLQVVA